MSGHRMSGVALVTTAVLFVAMEIGAPSWLRVSIAVLVFGLAPGLAVVGPVRGLGAALHWSLIVGCSMAVDLLGAQLLLSLGLFSSRSFLLGLVAFIAVAMGAWHLSARHRMSGDIRRGPFERVEQAP